MDFNNLSLKDLLTIKCIEIGGSFITAADSQLLDIFRQDQEQLMSQTILPSFVTKSLVSTIARYVKLYIQKYLEKYDQTEKLRDSALLEEAIRIEDEILYLFGVRRAELAKAIIDLGMETEFKI